MTACWPSAPLWAEPITGPGTVAAVMALLEQAASAERRADMGPRYGIHTPDALGVAMADMKRVAKLVGHDHDLAAGLWATGNYEARTVAALIDEPALVTTEQMDAWCADFDNWAICDTACFHLFDRSPDAWSRIEPWATSDGEFVKRAAFALLWALALHDKAAADDRFVAALAIAEREAADERPLVRKSIAMALKATARRNAELRAAVHECGGRLANSPHRAAASIGRKALTEG